MKVSQAGKDFIKSFEGWEPRAKDDGFGTLTIGWGHTSAAGPPRVVKGMTVTKVQGEKILDNDLAIVAADVTKLVKISLNQNQFDALISFDFNTGGLRRSSLLRDINNRHTGRIRSDFLLWVKSGKRTVRGLVRRRSAEANLYMKGTSNARKSR